MKKDDDRKSLDDMDSGDGGVVISLAHGGRTYRDSDTNLRVDGELTAEGARSALNRAPAKFAYWASLASDVRDELKKTKASFEFWKTKKAALVRKEYPRATEAFRVAEVMVTFPTEWKAYTAKIRELEYALDKLETLIKAYEMQSKTLIAVLYSLNKEMEITN